MPHDEQDLTIQKAPVELQENVQEQKESEKEQVKEKKMSSYMNVGDTMLEHMDAPLQKQLKKLPELKDLNRPTKKMVVAAHKDLGLIVSQYSWKHPKRVKRAKAKFKKQEQLLAKQNKTYEPDDEFLEIEINRIMNLDLTKLLYEEDEKGADEVLLKHWDRLHQIFAYIDSCAEHLQADKAKENLTDFQKDDLCRQEAHIKALVDVRTYYQVQEALMKNRYYALLPREEMKNISENNLRVYIAKLYEKRPGERNVELIDYYQNLLRLKTLGITDGKSLKKKQDRYYRELSGAKLEDRRNAKDEMNKISDAYKKLLDVWAKKGSLYNLSEMYKREDQFFGILGKDIEKFKEDSGFTEKRTLIRRYNEWKARKERDKDKKYNETIGNYVEKNMDGESVPLEKRDNPLEGITLTPAQKDGMQRIQGLLLRRAWQERNSKDSFVYSFLQTPPEQQIVVFYLIEKGKEKSAVPADLYTAINTYEPNLDAFREKINAKLLSLDSTQWSKMSFAVQAVKELSGEIKDYADLKNATQKADNELSAVEKDNSDAKLQGRKTIEAISYHTAALKQMYSNSGLGDDMPPDLAQDEKLRQRMYTEYDRVMELTEKLVKIIEDNPELAAEIEASDKAFKESKFEEKREKGFFAKTFGVGKTYKQAFGITNTVDGIGFGAIGFLSGTVKKFRSENKYYNSSFSSLSELASIVGFIDNIVGAFDMKKEETVSLSDNIIKWTGKANSLVGGAKGLVSGGLKILKYTRVVDTESKTVVKMNTGFDAISLITSGVSVGLGVAKLGSIVDSGKSIKVGNKMLEQRKKNNKNSKDDEKLARFFKHQGRENKRMTVSAAFDIAKEVISFTTSLSGLTGILAPVAGILKIVNGVAGFAFNLLYNSRKRKANIKKAVDEYLGVDKMIEGLKERKIILDEKVDDKTRKMVRDEALGRLGYATHKECFNDICRQFAKLIYGKIFLGESKDADEWNMYNRALDSLGFDMVKYKKDFGANPKPSFNAILTKVLG